jgi:hypothetical protein
MSVSGTPAAAGQPPLGSSFAADGRDWLRLLGGVLFAAGAVVLGIRKAADWGDWPKFLVYAIPCVLLYVLALRVRRGVAGLEGWRSGYVTFAALLLPATLLQLAQALGVDTSSRLTFAVVFALAAAIPVFVGQWVGAWWQMLIAGLYVIVAWLALWAKLLDHPSPETIRVLILIIAAILLAVGVVLTRLARPGASDVITVAGIAGILAGAISLSGLNAGFTSFGAADSSAGPLPTQGWNLYMLVVSLVLIGYAAKSRTRGPGYVGATGLLIFIGLVGLNVVTRNKHGDFSEITAVVGWPLVLLVVGGAAVVASFVMGGGRGVGAELGPSGPGGAAQGAYVTGAPAEGQPPRPAGAEQPTQQRPLPPPPPGGDG